MKLKRATIALLSILLTACNSEQTSTIAPISITSATNTVTAFFPISTLTSIPTETPFPTIQATETIPVATLNAVATLDTIKTDLKNRFPELQDYPVSCSSFACYDIQTSPNKELVYITNNNTINLFRNDGIKIGSYSFYDLYGYRINYRSGYVFPLHWAEDGRVLYVTANTGGDGGPEPYLNYESTLVRIHLETGTWDDLGISGSFEISPDEQFVIYSNKENEIRIRDISSGQEIIYPHLDDYFYFGKYVWSPDSKKIIFIGTSESWETDESKFALILVAIENQTISLVSETGFPFYFPIYWASSNKITLNKFNEWGEWTLDLSTKPPTIIP